MKKHNHIKFVAGYTALALALIPFAGIRAAAPETLQEEAPDAFLSSLVLLPPPASSTGATTGTLVVYKDVLSATGTDISDLTSFSFTLNGANTTSVREGAEAVLTLSAGDYFISENAHSGYTFDTIGPSATATVIAGATTTVTIFNKKDSVSLPPVATSTGATTGTLVVYKDVLDENGADVSDTATFTFSLNGTNTTPFKETGEAVLKLDEGTYAVSENPLAGYVFDSIIINGVATSTATVTAGATTTVTIFNRQETTTTTPPATTASAPASVATGGSSGSAGQVLGATTDDESAGDASSTPLIACQAYLLSYMRRGQSNDSAQVQKLQAFLNKNLGLDIPLTGFFGSMTENAVKSFQLKYAEQILAPWVKLGLLANTQAATGYVYKTTLHEINLLSCPSLGTPAPLLP